MDICIDYRYTLPFPENIVLITLWSYAIKNTHTVRIKLIYDIYFILDLAPWTYSTEFQVDKK